MLSYTSSQERLSVSMEITDPLLFLLSLQSLFKTNEKEGGYESWKYQIRNHHILYISTNNRNEYVLGVKSGYIVFPFSDAGREPISGKDICAVLMEFCKRMERFQSCIIKTTEESNGTEIKFTYKLKLEEGEIVRDDLQMESYSENRFYD